MRVRASTVPITALTCPRSRDHATAASPVHCSTAARRRSWIWIWRAAGGWATAPRRRAGLDVRRSWSASSRARGAPEPPISAAMGRGAQPPGSGGRDPGQPRFSTHFPARGPGLLSPAMAMRVAVAVSGRGSNLEALLRALGPDAPAQVVLVVSNRSDAGALERARAYGIPVEVLSDPASAADWLDPLERYRVDLLVLAGYLKLVPADVIARYRHRIMNIHPALLPAFGGRGMYGRHVHEAVLRERGTRVRRDSSPGGRGVRPRRHPRPASGPRAPRRHGRASRRARAGGRASTVAGGGPRRGAGRSPRSPSRHRGVPVVIVLTCRAH